MKHAVQYHHGEIVLRSELNKGAIISAFFDIRAENWDGSKNYSRIIDYVVHICYNIKTKANLLSLSFFMPYC